MVSTVPGFRRSIVNADATTWLEDDVVGLVRIAVGSKLGDVNWRVAIVDEFYSGEKQEWSHNYSNTSNTGLV